MKPQNFSLMYPSRNKSSTITLVLLALLATTGVVTAADIRSGKEVYDASCGGCHASGVLGAPKLGDNQDWGNREQQGFEVLLTHALKGFKNMPAKGGNPTIKDQEVEAAVKYMLAGSGLDQYAQATQSGQVESKTEQVAKADRKESTPQTRSSSVNSFNRLMKSADEWNLPPSEDGIHDPDNGGTHMLQKPKQAFEALNPSKSGNRVDWVKALDNNQISPRYDRIDDQAKPIIMDLDIVREVKGSMPDVVYPHKQHTEWLDCSNCHPAIFIPQKGANQISMAAILLGQKCGVCHGKVAFPVSECRRCHSKQKTLKTTDESKTTN